MKFTKEQFKAQLDACAQSSLKAQGLTDTLICFNDSDYVKDNLSTFLNLGALEIVSELRNPTEEVVDLEIDSTREHDYDNCTDKEICKNNNNIKAFTGKESEA